MARKDESIETAQAKYNRLVARFRDLQQQTNEKQEEWEKIQREAQINETLARELCELILAKDPSEMRLGAEYSWSRLPTREIIEKSKQTFSAYNESRTALLKSVQRQSEDRRLMVESLTDQLEQKTHENERLRSMKAESGDENRVSEPEAKAPVPDKAMKRAPLSVQQAAESGDVDVLMYEDEDVMPTSASGNRPDISEEDIARGMDKPGRPGKKRPVATNMKVWEERKDLSAKDLEQQADMSGLSVLTSLERSAGTINRSPVKEAFSERQKAAAEKQFVAINVSEIAEKLNEKQWKIIEVMGSTGLCEASDIIDAAMGAFGDAGETQQTNSGMRYALMALGNQGCILSQNVNNPQKSRFFVYSLSDIGKSLYISKFNKQPVTSEIDLLIADHDNLEHAFGIKELKRVLETSGAYTDVSMNRSANTVILKDGTKYIPDITAQAKSRSGKSSYQAYFEYERATHHQADFSIKLNKAVKVTRYINIVCPNTDISEKLKGKVSEWIESRGGGKNLRGIKVRITSIRKLTGQRNINDDSNWLYVYNLGSGSDAPVERLSS